LTIIPKGGRGAKIFLTNKKINNIKKQNIYILIKNSFNNMRKEA